MNKTLFDNKESFEADAMDNADFTTYREKSKNTYDDFGDEKNAMGRSSKDGRHKQCLREDSGFPKCVLVDKDGHEYRGIEESSYRTKSAKVFGELEREKERRYHQSASRPKSKPEAHKQTHYSPMPTGRQDELVQAKHTTQSPPVAWYQRSGPLRSIYDFTPQHPRDDRTDKAPNQNKSGEPVDLEQIINKEAVARIIQRRQEIRSNFEEVPNRSPAYDTPGMRWGVPLCIYDYCPQKSTGHREEEEVREHKHEDFLEGQSKPVKRSGFQEVPNRSPAYDQHGMRWGVPLCVYDYCPQKSSRGHAVSEASDVPSDEINRCNKSIQTDCLTLRKRHDAQKPRIARLIKTSKRTFNVL